MANSLSQQGLSQQTRWQWVQKMAGHIVLSQKTETDENAGGFLPAVARTHIR